MGLRTNSHYSQDFGVVGVAYTSNRNYRVRIDVFRTNGYANLSVDGVSVATNVWFIDSLFGSISGIQLFNSGLATVAFDDFSAWKDNQRIGLTNRPRQIICSNGRWNGDVTVHELGTNVFLNVDDGFQHVGNGSLFTVIELPLADTNSNTLPDAWERQYFGGLVNPLADADGDGFLNRDELQAGTNPTNSASVLRVLSINTASNTVTFPTVFGKRYRLQTSQTIPATNWIESSSIILGTGENMAVPMEFFGSAPRYFRVQMLP